MKSKRIVIKAIGANQYSSSDVVIKVGDTDWMEDILLQLQNINSEPEDEIFIDLSDIDFIGLYEWTTILAYLEYCFVDKKINTINIDLLGKSKYDNLLTREEMSAFKNNLPTKRLLTNDMFQNSERIYRLAGFLQSIGTTDVLNKNERINKIVFPYIGEKGSKYKSFYATKDDRITIVFGMIRIETKEDCKIFLDNERIQAWRDNMQSKYLQSPFFNSEELWRIFCHELSVNIWEHSGSSGFLTARVVEPYDEHNQLKSWCKWTYSHLSESKMKNFKEGFVELCVADAGKGFSETLQKVFKNTFNYDYDVADLIQFAFGKLGTSKSKEDSWATERHALGNMLQLVTKYGGVLKIQTDSYELIYDCIEGKCNYLNDHKGYQPTQNRKLKESIRGVQYQLIIPLNPKALNNYNRANLYSTLPNTFRTQPNHVHGHLIPLLELLDQPGVCVGKEEQINFKYKCEVVCREIISKRPDMEPLVLDFGGLNWTPSQFETLLYLFKNVLQNRPALIIELNPGLANEIRVLEKNTHETMLTEEVANISKSLDGKAYGHIPETYFMEAYTRVHSTILGLDSNGERYLFGLIDHKCEDALLSLIDEPKSFHTLSTKYGVKENIINSILNRINPLFKINNGKWECMWDKTAIETEATRVITNHFDDIAKKSFAWRGKKYNDQEELKNLLTDKGNELFNLPWENSDEWVSEYFESSRILSRSRYIDEYAQRLIYRLKKGLEFRKKSLSEINVLASLTAPSLLLATAIYRWWPSNPKPVVADLGYYMMISNNGDIPLLSKNSNVIIVQDVINTGNISDKLIAKLKSLGNNVFGLISLVKLENDLNETRLNSIYHEWEKNVGTDYVPKHSMISIKKPIKSKPPANLNNGYVYWVEPRTLKPINYKNLIDPPTKNSPFTKERDEYLRQNIFEPENGVSPFNVGHYVYGQRHFNITMNFQQLLNGQVGNDVANWIADICEANEKREKPYWENVRGRQSTNEITFVLMPLHSQIHYLWQKVENVLAQRGRRQPLWLLDATLFLGQGPIYTLPFQLEYQIWQTANEIYNYGHTTATEGISIFIVDDSIVTGQTLETIIDSIFRLIDRVLEKYARPKSESKNIVKLIRCFSVFNHMDYAKYNRWHEQTTLGGERDIQFIFEELYQHRGVKVYESDNCPYCQKQMRYNHLREVSSRLNFETVNYWVNQQLGMMMPISVDGIIRTSDSNKLLKKPINTLGNIIHDKKYNFLQVNSAIVSFYELMYRSYPPNEALLSLNTAFGSDIDLEEKSQYEKYRINVFEWCFRNWAKLRADGATRRLIEFIKNEIEINSDIIIQIFEGIANKYEEEEIKELISYAIDKYARLEINLKNAKTQNNVLFSSIIKIEDAINIFILSLPKETIKEYTIIDNQSNKIRLIDYLEKKSEEVGNTQLGLIKNITMKYSSMQTSHIRPIWSLRNMQECLYRGFNPSKPPEAWTHFALMALMKKVLKKSNKKFYKHVLQNELSRFVSALESLRLHFYIDGDYKIKKRVENILAWLKLPESNNKSNHIPHDYTKLLFNDLKENGELYSAFNNYCHQNIKVFAQNLVDRYNLEPLAKQLDFHIDYQNKYDLHLLTNISRLHELLYNWTIQPIQHYPDKICKSKISIIHTKRSSEIVFNIFTSYSDAEETRNRISQSNNYIADKLLLKPFGVDIDLNWSSCYDEDAKEGYLAKTTIVVPSGYIERI